MKLKNNTTATCITYTFFIMFACFVISLNYQQAYAEDWITYMHDNSRSGVTAEDLDVSKLNQAWVYTSPAPPRTAWSGPAPGDSGRENAPLPATRDFDTAFFVTVVNDSVYFGSSVTNSVHCLNIHSGSEKWFHNTYGPVRFPPSYYNGKLYFGSDDGYVYCADAANGSKLWKYSPSGNTRLLGNNRNVVPMWPIRTGAGIYDGKVYFAASLVPWKAPYLCSLDAETGADSGTGLYKTQPVIAVEPYSRGVLTPMGAILLSPTKIYLPQGRMSAYAFDRITGSPIGMLSTTGQGIFGWMNNWSGGTYALLTPDSRYFQGHSRLGAFFEYDIEGDYLFEFNAETRDMIACHDSASAMVVSGGNSYIIEKSFDKHPAEGFVTDVYGKVKCVLRSNGSTQWSKSNLDYAPYVLIKAGDNIFVGGTKKVVAYNSSNGNEVWSKTVTGRVRGLAAANGYLFVSTDTGHVYAFGGMPYDLSGDGKVDLDDLFFFIRSYLKCTNPNDPDCQPNQ